MQSPWKCSGTLWFKDKELRSEDKDKEDPTWQGLSLRTATLGMCTQSFHKSNSCSQKLKKKVLLIRTKIPTVFYPELVLKYKLIVPRFPALTTSLLLLSKT